MLENVIQEHSVQDNLNLGGGLKTCSSNSECDSKAALQMKEMNVSILMTLSDAEKVYM